MTGSSCFTPGFELVMSGVDLIEHLGASKKVTPSQQQ